MKILLTGATGYIGKRLLPVLLEQGHEVICCVRDKRRFSLKPSMKKASVFEVDFLEEVNTNQAPMEFDIAYYLIHSMSAAIGEFNKMEGVNINFDLASTWWNNGDADGAQAYMYMAMSSFTGAMADDVGSIQLDGTHGNCGLVYRMKLVKNSDGNVDATHMIPPIVGVPCLANWPSSPRSRTVSPTCFLRSIPISLSPNRSEITSEAITASAARKEMYWNTPKPGTSKLSFKKSKR
mgnify:CR=1 FL=1